MSVDPIARVVLEELRRRDKTVISLAGESGVDRDTIGRWLNGQRSIRLVHLLAISKALNLAIVISPEMANEHRTEAHEAGADQRSDFQKVHDRAFTPIARSAGGEDHARPGERAPA